MSRGISLIVMHNNTNFKHVDGDSDQFLTYYSWDNHSYFVTDSRPCVLRKVQYLHTHIDVQKVNIVQGKPSTHAE